MGDRLLAQRVAADLAARANREAGIPPAAADEVRNEVVAAIERGDAASLTQLAAEATASDLRGTASQAREAAERIHQSQKEAAIMSVRFLGHQDLPVTPAQRAAQQDDVALREVQRQRVEREQAEREFEQEELARLRAGFPTARQTKAEEILRYLHGLTSGYWAFHNAADATNQSTLDGGAALRLVTTAAVEAVREALQPMLERAEHELEAAVEERRAILERGHR